MEPIAFTVEEEEEELLLLLLLRMNIIVKLVVTKHERKNDVRVFIMGTWLYKNKKNEMSNVQRGNNPKWKMDEATKHQTPTPNTKHHHPPHEAKASDRATELLPVLVLYGSWHKSTVNSHTTVSVVVTVVLQYVL